MSDDKVPWVHRPPAGGEYYVFRDPIHNLIAIQDDEEGRFIRAILDTKELQRLRRIAQNGVAAYVYPGLEATRFPHSLGSYYIAKKIITSLQERQPSEREGFPRPLHITPRDCVAFPLAALLHDIGHGPLSHAWEEIFHTHPQFQSHEALGHAIVESTATEIGDLLHKVSTGDEAYKRLFPNLLGIKEDLLDFLKGRHRLSYLQPLLAGNLDVDRMDFMARDTQNAGVTYGVHELEWLIRSLRFARLPAHLSDGRSDAEWVIAIDGRKGLAALNQFLRARENMYRLVYHHKTSRGAQMLLGSIMKRAMELTKESQSEKAPFCSHSFARWMRNEEFSLNDYLRLDDTDVWSHVKLWADSKDSVLGPLCRQMLSRSFFKVLQISEETYRILRQIDEPSMGHHLSNIIQLRGNFDSALASHFYAFREDSLLLVGREPRDFSSKVWLMRAGVLGHIYTSLHDYWRAELGREDQGELRVISYSLGIHRRFLGDILNLVDHLESRFAGQIGPSLLYGAGPRPPDPYRVVTSLGAPGEWKEVYLGLCSRVGVRKDTLYALKCYRDNRTHEIVSAKRRDIYSQRLVRAQSPHLSETFEIGEEDGRHWLGETLWTSSLDRFVREYGPFRDLREIARMATHLYRGLAALHEYDLRHTDLKPDNCGFVQEGRLNRRYLIGDFGCVDPDPSLVPSDPLMLGTQRTRAPEVWRTPPSIGLPSDVWALGATIYSLCRLRYPFMDYDVPHGNTNERQELADSIRDRLDELLAAFEADVEENLPPLLYKVLMSALRRQPSDRQAARALAHAFQSLQETVEHGDKRLILAWRRAEDLVANLDSLSIVAQRDQQLKHTLAQEANWLVRDAADAVPPRLRAKLTAFAV